MAESTATKGNKEPSTNIPELERGSASVKKLTTAEHGMRALVNTAEGLECWAKSLHLQDIRSFMEASPEFKQALEDVSRGIPPLEYLAKWACWDKLGKNHGPQVKWEWSGACHACRIRLCINCTNPMGTLVYEYPSTKSGAIYVHGSLCKACYDRNQTAPELAAQHTATWGDDDTTKQYARQGMKLKDQFFIPFCF